MAEKYYFVRDIPESWSVVQNSQDIDAIAEYIGAPDLSEEFGCLFVELADGDYGFIYGCSSFVPYLGARVWDVDEYLESARWQLWRREVGEDD